MKKNLGAEDRVLRVLVGIALLVNIIVLTPGLVGTIVLAVLGIALTVTGILGFCSLYVPFKIDTRSFYEKQEDSAGKA
jgi:hypothetical protein